MGLQHVLKNSVVSGKEPTASQLANGEIALNYHADGPFLTCKDTNGEVRRLASANNSNATNLALAAALSIALG